MARNPMQKQKLLYVMKLLLTKTDENHGMTISELKDALKGYGITAERKSLYDDLRTLEAFGLDICAEKTRTVKYYIGSRDFQISELKLLVDAIQSSKFITEKKSLELIRKLEGLAGENEAELLQNQVIISNRVKTGNETIYYNIDRLHDAIGKNLSVNFYYNQWVLDLGSTEKLRLERRHGGKLYRVSPYALMWDDENYYLVGYDEQNEDLRHYRVDKMEKIELTGEKRLGAEVFSHIDPAEYAKSTFSMYAGKRAELTLSISKRLAGVIADRFGRNVFIFKDEKNDENFMLKVSVNISKQFYGWLFALGDEIKIISPAEAAEEYRAHCERVMGVYGKVKE